jgi:hypothetical protein
MIKSTRTTLSVLAIAAASLHQTAAFTASHATTPQCTQSPRTSLFESYDNNEPEKKKGFFANFFEELDAFVDDATSRRLGAGAQYYGKRKSSFYGKDDANKKKDKGVFDPTGMKV